MNIYISPYLIIVFLFVLSCDNSSTSVPDVEEDLEYQLVWSDEFDGDQLDTNKWSYQLGTGSQFGLTGWGNNELQYYTDREENVYVEDGMLHIVAKEEFYQNRYYTSARIRTINKADWKYGRFEIRAKMPEGQGIWPAVWMLPTEEVYGGWPKSGEIDIMELVGHRPSTVHGTVHYGPDWPNNRYKGSSFSLDGEKFSDDFNIFSIEWVEDEIKWFVNDNLFHTITPSSLSPQNYPFNEQFHLILNLAVGGNWPGDPDNTTEFPQSMIIDYIKVYQLR